MPRIVGVRLRHAGQFYDFDAADMDLRVGDWVVVETSRGQDLGQVLFAPSEVAAENVRGELKPVVRLANESDLRRMERSREKEAEVLARAREKVAEAGIPMRLVAAEYTYNGRSLTIYFTAEKRVDFRDLVRELAREFRARIELRQIGARDEARLLGGIASCGRELCCATFLQDFTRISVRMAKEQDLPLSPMKISGVCGRLLCCLSYEADQYREIKSGLPDVGQEVTTLRGRGTVVAVSVPRESVTVEVRPGVLVEVQAEDLAQVEQLELEGRLSGPRPAEGYSFEEEVVEEVGMGPAREAAAEAAAGGDRARRRRRRKKGGAEGAVGGRPGAERSPGVAAGPERKPAPPGPGRRPHRGSPGGKPPAERRPAPERPAERAETSRRRRPRRRLPTAKKPQG